MNGLQGNVLLSPVIAAAERTNPCQAKDHISEDGLLICGCCGKPKQAKMMLNGREIIRPAPCTCAAARLAEEAAAEAAQKHRETVMRLRQNSFPDTSFWEKTFANDDGQEPNMRRLRRYADLWSQVYADNTGLLLWGGVGNGKTYAAASVANAVIEEHEATVLVTSFPVILNELMGRTSDRNAYVESIVRPQLLVIDDLGAERDSPFALEQIYNVIDARYRQHRPLIITTNLSLSEIKNPPSVNLARIYDRILEMCAPVQFKTPSRRRVAAQENLNRLAALLDEPPV